IELGGCYYREGLFDLARATLRTSLQSLSDDESELKAVALIRLASVERHAGRLHEALSSLDEAAPLVNTSFSWTQGRLHSEYATTLKELGIAENRIQYFDKALGHYREAFLQFEKVGNLRFVAAVENNHGYLLLTLKRFDEAQVHLQRARKLFDGLNDSVGRAQVDETLAQLHVACNQHGLAERSVRLAVDTLETTGETVLLAEALTTQGLVLCRLARRHEAKPILERAQRVAARCGDHESSGRTLLIMIEEMCEQISDDERREIGARLNQLLANSQQASTRERLSQCLEKIEAAHVEHEAHRERAAHADKMAALGELAFGVAHNVNNSLAAILGRAQLLLRTTDPAKMATGLEMIIKGADDGAHIIRRIQDFARQLPSHEFQVVSISQLMKDAWEMTRPRWESRRGAVEIRFALGSDCPAFVMGDPVELREVLVNMIYNAVDALPRGGEIRLSAEETKGRVIVSITDTGTGMRPEVKARLFDPFFTTKGKSGTGMGMAVSFGIVRRHDGFIEVKTAPGHGTTFRISLATVVMSGTPNADLVPALTSMPDAKDDVRLRVMVVDDEVAIRDVLVEALEAEGCEVIAAASGEIALELYDAHGGELDAVFTDVDMPDMSGWELIEAIRKRSTDIPVAIVSGWGDSISCDTRNASKVDWIVSKPFDIDSLSQIACEIADRKKRAA
ncbi:MAG: ATP-binding protein, partial [Pyrinomonadaceae bacterium]